MENISHVSDYLKKIQNKIDDIHPHDCIVYRGEPQNYRETACCPNLFRKDYLLQNPYFEKNLFDEMKSNYLTQGESYIEMAIDAQHGGFPSRLLDVSYNCLIALYFATTPYYTEKETSLDTSDGMIYLYGFENIYCPSGSNVQTIYDHIVKRDCQWLHELPVFAHNHKFVDHIKTNKRIIAQQGAFILFQGDTYCPISENEYIPIKIPKESKAVLRKELKTLFGIHTGSVYPEVSNQVKELTEKSMHIVAQPFSLCNELELSLYNLRQYLQSFINDIKKNKKSDDVFSFLKDLQTKEELLLSYHESFAGLDLYKDECREKLTELEMQYDSMIEGFYHDITAFAPNDFVFSKSELMIKEENKACD